MNRVVSQLRHSRNLLDVDDLVGAAKLLLDFDQQVGAAGEHARFAVIAVEQRHRFVERGRREVGEAPHAVPSAAARLEGSCGSSPASSWRSTFARCSVMRRIAAGASRRASASTTSRISYAPQY